MIILEQILHICEDLVPILLGAQRLRGRVLDSRPRGARVRVSPASLRRVLEQDTVIVASTQEDPSLHNYINEKLLIGHKESNQTKKQTNR